MSANFDNDLEFSDVVPKPRSRRGFRIGEMMAVVAIIAVLIALMLPLSRRGSGPPARRAQCTNNLKQIAMALRNYEQVHKALAPAYTLDANGRPLHSWRTLILPYLEQESLYETIDLTRPWNDPANANACQTSLSVFRCPEANGPLNTTTYLAIAAPNGCLIPGKCRLLTEISDAHDLTLMVIDAGEENAVPWMAPVDADESLVVSIGRTTKLHHAGGFSAAFVDGSVKFLRASTSAAVRRALLSIAGNDNEVAQGWE